MSENKIPTKAYSAMLYTIACEVRDNDGCVTVAPERIEEAAERLDSLTIVIRGQKIQYDDMRASMLDTFSVAHRLALELECLLLSCTDTAATAKWWDSANEALDQWRDFCREDANGQPEKQAKTEIISAPALVFYPAGSIGEEVEEEGRPG